MVYVTWKYDEDDEAYYCSVNMDEDDMARFMQSSYKECPYYRSGDEYKVVRHQMQSVRPQKVLWKSDRVLPLCK